MNHDSLEEALNDLGRQWPVPSCATEVMAQIENSCGSAIGPVLSDASRNAIPLTNSRLRWRLGLCASAAAAAIVLAFSFLTVMSTPLTLQAQMERALAKATSAHIIHSVSPHLDEQGVRRETHTWYSHEHGVRTEFEDLIVIDDGRQIWIWKPQATDLVVRRRSADPVRAITEMFDLKSIPADWKQRRAAEHDRLINGQRCRGYVAAPLYANIPQPGSPPWRDVLWLDPQDRIVATEEQHLIEGKWQVEEQLQIHYDEKPLPKEKFVPNFPVEAKIVDGETLLEERFPLAKALGTVQSEGVLFAIHKIERMDGKLERMKGGMFFIVSSVRGTPEYFQEYPLVPRRPISLTTIVDVAKQTDSPSSGRGLHRAVLASAEWRDVHYVWWIATPWGDSETFNPDAYPDALLEIAPGKVRIPLEASKWVSEGRLSGVSAALEVSAPATSRTLEEVAAGVRREAALLQLAMIPSNLVGGVRDHTTHMVEPDKISDADYVAEVRQQFNWFRELERPKAAPSEDSSGQQKE
jgi:hypothetical protein